MKRISVVVSLCRSKDDEKTLSNVIDDELGPERDYLDIIVTHSKDEYLRALEKAEILFAHRLPVDGQGVLRSSGKLRWVQTAGAGVDDSVGYGIDDVGFTLTNCRGMHSARIAEYVMGSIIAFSKGFFVAMKHQSNHRWARRELIESNRTLAGKTLGILGLGNLGSAVARVARPFGLEVLGLRRHPEAYPAPRDVTRVFGPQNLREFIHPLDYLVVAVPLTKETRHIIDKEELVRLKTSALVVNVSRGAVIDEEALVDALRMGEIGGAVLDVFEEEPLPPDSPLWSMENVFVTPHVAGVWPDYLKHAARVFARNLRNYLEGRPLLNVVDLQRGY